MSGAQKRKHYEAATCADRHNERPVEDNQPQIQRHRLQRASKDRTYAERLVTVGESVVALNGSGDVASYGGNVSRRSEAAANTKGRSRKKKQEVPPDCPFIDTSLSAREIDGTKKQSIPRNTESRLELDVNDLPVLTRRQQNELSSVGSISCGLNEHDNHAHLCKKRTQHCRGCKNTKIAGIIDTSNLKDNCASPQELVENFDVKSSDKEAVDNEELKESQDATYRDFNETSPKPTILPKPTVNSAKTWACSRCTLSNSNRRKKCEACGNIRNLVVASDGTFALSDSSGRSNALGLGDVDTVDRGVHNLQTKIDNTEHSSSNELQVEASVSENDGPTPVDTDLFVIASEPVSTRSRFKQFRLSQSMTQKEIDLNHSQPSESAMDIDMDSEQNGSSLSTNTIVKNHQQSEDNSFRIMIKKRKSDRHAKAKAKRVKKYLQQNGKVEIRVRLSSPADADFEIEHHSLAAYIPSEVLSQMSPSLFNSSVSLNETDLIGGIEVQNERTRISAEDLIDEKISVTHNISDVSCVQQNEDSSLKITTTAQSSVAIINCCRKGDFSQSSSHETVDDERAKMSEIKVRVALVGSDFDLESNVCLIGLVATEVLSSVHSSAGLACNYLNEVDHKQSESTGAMTAEEASKDITLNLCKAMETNGSEILHGHQDNLTTMAESDMKDIDDHPMCTSPHYGLSSPEVCSSDSVQNITSSVGGNRERHILEEAQCEQSTIGNDVSIQDSTDTTKIENAEENSSSSKSTFTIYNNSSDSEYSQKQIQPIVEVSDIQMTQQTPEFDYYSQASKESNTREVFMQTSAENIATENRTESHKISIPNRKPFSNAESNLNKTSEEISASYLDAHKQQNVTGEINDAVMVNARNKVTSQVSNETVQKVDNILDSEDSATVNDTDVSPPLLAFDNGTEQDLVNKIQPNVSKSLSIPLFHEVGEKATDNVSDVSLNKASKIFNYDASDVTNTVASASVKDTNVKNPLYSIPSKSHNTLLTPTSSLLLHTSNKGTTKLSSATKIQKNDKFHGNDAQISASTMLSAFDEPVAALDRRAISAKSQSSLSFPMFQTAGKKQTIKVSAEALSKVDKLFHATASSTSDPTATSSSTSNHDDKNHIKHLLKPSSLPMFQTAGTKTTIKLSDEAISNVSELFEMNTSLFETFKHASLSCDSASGNPLVSTKERAQCVNKQSHVTNVTAPALPMFQTAGKQIAIKVSDDALSRVEKLFDYKTYNNASDDLVSTSDTEGVKTHGLKTQLALDKAVPNTTKIFNRDTYINASANLTTTSMAQAANLEGAQTNGLDTHDVPPSNPSRIPVFQTAGKKTLIKVSEESLSKVSKFFSSSDPVIGGMAANDQHGIHTTNVSVHSNYLNQVDKESQIQPPESHDKLPNESPPTIGFQTAGKKTTIRVSDDILSKVSKLFDDGTPRYESRNKDIQNLSTPCLQPLFPTKDTTMKVSALKANNFFEDSDCDTKSIATQFLKAPAIATTNASPDVKGDASVCNTDEQYSFSTIHSANVPSNEVINRRFSEIDTEKNEQSNDESYEDLPTKTPLIDRSILKQSTCCDKKKNKVRFSLEPPEQCAFSRDTFYQTVVTVEKGLAVDNDTVKANEGPMPEMGGSFVTPDKRHPHPMEVEEEPNSSEFSATILASGEQRSSSDSMPKSRQTTIDYGDNVEESHSTYFHERSNLYTPLYQTSKNPELQSEIKSKKLFDGEPAHTKSDVDAVTRTRTRKWSFKQQHCNRVSLSSFSLRKTTKAICQENGVSDVTLRITSANANKLRFSLEDGLPLFIVGQRDVPKRDNVGKVCEIKKWLIAENCDESLFTDKWVQNHYRWIVWKLAAMERSFSKDLGGHYLAYDHVLKQMKRRYEKELRLAHRPAVRKLLNRDVPACMPMILCVSQIQRFRSKTNNGSSKEEVRLELTDGWYALPATLDKILLQFVEKGKIKVGTKLMISNAQLLGLEDGVDPLDESYSSLKRDCPLYISINANSVRLARWDATLGFVSPLNSKLHKGSLIVKSLNDVFIGGGLIGAIDFIVCKRYPKMYLEEVNGSSIHLSEAENAARQLEHNSRYQRASEKFADMVQNDCIEDIDNDAPQQWKDMQQSNTPSDFYHKLDIYEKKAVDEWTNKRAVLLDSMISKSVEDSLQEMPSMERKSKPYAKLLVRIFSPKDNVGNNAPRSTTKKTVSEVAELTIWRVSDEQFDMIREGYVVRMKNLVVRSKTKHGMLQLSANHETPIELPLRQPTHEKLVQSGYNVRRPKSLIQIHVLAKQEIGAKNTIDNEFDVVSCIVKVVKVGENTTLVYLTDESGLVVKLKRDHKIENSDPFSLGNTTLPTVVAFSNLRITSFDEHEHCAVASWELQSCKSDSSIKERSDYLQSWCNSDLGMICCKTALDKINAGIPFGNDHFIKTKVCFGYILSVEEEQNTAAIDVVIDYGDDVIKACLPIHLLQNVIQLLQNNSSKKNHGLSGLPLLCRLMSYNRVLLRFDLNQISSYGGESPMLEIIGLSLAKVDELARLHL